MADVVLDEEIERFRERLLDLSLRNPLISYRKSKRRTLQVVDELPDAIFERLVESGKPFTFACVADPTTHDAADKDAADKDAGNIAAGDEAAETSDGSVVEPAEPLRFPVQLPEPVAERAPRHVDDQLQTNLRRDKLDALLRYMQREAETAMQETGINYLFLAIGFLSWRESDSSEKDRQAPLLLIPVRLEREVKSTGPPRFTIAWDEDEVQSNLSLQKKLARDFALVLPEFSPETTPEAYFEQVRAAVGSRPGWDISRESLLGFFSFHKLSMYADIDPVNWDLQNGAAAGSVIERLICGATNDDAEPFDARLYAPDYDIDQNATVEELILSLDADSSQQSALVDIRNGRNLVIEGPPGTGKSQTITNAIADAIGNGKTVLFVAEKLAALQVVHNRLASLGLDDFCLELHSDGASPRQVFASLQKRLAASYEAPQELETQRQTLAELRTRLNGYVAEMGETVGPTRIPLYDLLWRIVTLRSEGATFTREWLNELPTDRRSFQTASAELRTFARVLGDTPEPRASPWWGFFPEDFAARRTDEIAACLDAIHAAAADFRDTTCSLADAWGVTPPEVTAICQRLDLDAITASADQMPPAAVSLAGQLIRPEAIRGCEDLLAAIDDREASLRKLSDRFGTDPDSLRAIEPELTGLLDLPGWAAGTQVEQIEAARIWLSELDRLTDAAIPFVEPLEACGTVSRNVLADLADAIKLVRLSLHPIVEQSDCVTAAMFDETAKPVLRDAYRESERLRAERAQNAEELDRLVAGTSCDTAVAVGRIESISAAAIKLRDVAGRSLVVEAAAAVVRWAGPAIATIDRLVSLADRLAPSGYPAVDHFDGFVRSAALVQLVRHPAVQTAGYLTEAMFTASGRRAFEQAFQTHQRLAARQQELAATFHLPAVPPAEEVTRIAKVFRRQRRSWFRFFNREYREARSRLDEFAAIGKKRKLDDWIRGLEELETLAGDLRSFADDAELAIQLGGGYRGFETDWESLRQRFDWAHTVGEYGLDYRAATRLLELRDDALSGVSNQELKRLEADFRQHFVAAESLAATLWVGGCARLALGELRQRVVVASAAATDLVSVAEAISAPASWSCDDLIRLAETLATGERLAEASRRFGEEPANRIALGAHFAGTETDWQRLETVFNWVRTAIRSGGDFEIVSRLLSQRGELRRDYRVSAATQCLADIEAHWEQRPASLTDAFDYRAVTRQQVKSQLQRSLVAIAAGLPAARSLGCPPTEPLEAIRERLLLVKRFDDADHQLRDPAAWAAARADGIYAAAMRDPVGVRAVLEWIDRAGKRLEPLPESVRAGIVRRADSAAMVSLCKHLERTYAARRQIADSRDQLARFGNVYPSWLVIDLDAILSGTLELECERLTAELARLPAWANFCRALAGCERGGLRKFCDAAIDGSLAAEHLSDSYELTVFEIVAEETFQSSELLRRTSGQAMYGLRKEFQRFDRSTRDLGRYEIASRAAARPVPLGNSKGRVGDLTELALIRHESQKQRRHCRIRDLMSRAGNAVQALKPCLMMSPLSVSRFIPEGSVTFDMVIMDEASQIKPEDAIGTMLRAKQVVVVGDPKQLPPTSFFDRLDEEVDEDESTLLDNTESILEAAMKVFQPFRRLRWHYRSKHENLIRFSNVRFYDNDLVVFPSPTGDDAGYGIRHVFVTDATCSGGLNMKEAEAVVDEIVRHAVVFPDQSLGVGTFNKKQSDAIEELLDQRCAVDPSAAIAIERLRQQQEGLFIKNLENLQGDERDVIFVCYTYGKDPASGRLMQRFGPINGQDGWRRLNVLITRSRQRMVVFSSIHPGDIHGGPDKSRGVNAYKDFLAYASTGTLDDGGSISGRAPDSPFEIAVCRQIERLGLEAVPQVGVAGFFVDIGVRRREGDRTFLLGIECDGATYHSARSARDRDRLREEIICARGWKIHRIWSTDWFLDQATEVNKLESAIAAASVPNRT